MKRLACLLGVLFAAQAVMADDIAVMDLTGVQLRNATNQTRTSAPDTVSPGYGYRLVVTGMVRGIGGYFGLRYPNPTPIEDVLEDIQPGTSELLASEVYNPSGALPFEVLNEQFSGEFDAGLFTVNYGATLSGGIQAGGAAYFSITNVTLTPPALVGYLQFTSGTATVTRVPAIPGDMNFDGLVNNFDIDPFIQGLTDPGLYTVTYGFDPIYAGDANRDGILNNFDIDPFIALLVQ